MIDEEGGTRVNPIQAEDSVNRSSLPLNESKTDMVEEKEEEPEPALQIEEKSEDSQESPSQKATV